MTIRDKFRVEVTGDYKVRVMPIHAPQGTCKLTVDEAVALVVDLERAIVDADRKSTGASSWKEGKS